MSATSRSWASTAPCRVAPRRHPQGHRDPQPVGQLPHRGHTPRSQEQERDHRGGALHVLRQLLHHVARHAHIMDSNERRRGHPRGRQVFPTPARRPASRMVIPFLPNNPPRWARGDRGRAPLPSCTLIEKERPQGRAFKSGSSVGWERFEHTSGILFTDKQYRRLHLLARDVQNVGCLQYLLAQPRWRDWRTRRRVIDQR